MHSWKIKPVVAALAAILVGGGCQKNSPGGAVGPQASVADTTPQPAPTKGSMRLITGAAPLQYLLASGGVVRVMDVTAGEQLLKDPVPPQTMIKIDPNAGLNVGARNIIPGPLPSGHKYEIWLDRN